MLQRRLESAWSMVLSTMIVITLAYIEISFNQWRVLIAVGLLLTVIMLFHERLRHFILLPSAIAFASVITMGLMTLRMME